MEKVIKITKVILNFIMSIIIVIGILFIILFAIGIEPFVVKSGSMEPTIQTGSVCFINKRADYNKMKVGKIIAFKIEKNTLVTHRIYSINEDGFKTKGDANLEIDGVVTTPDNFIGENIFSIPKVGYVVNIMQTTKGKIVIGVVIALLFITGILIGEPSKRKNKKTN